MAAVRSAASKMSARAGMGWCPGFVGRPSAGACGRNPQGTAWGSRGPPNCCHHLSMELPKIDVDLDEPAEPAGPSPAHRVWAVVVVIQALAALAVGLVVSVVGFFGNATISLLASMLPWSDPVRLAVPLFVAGAVLAAVVARRVRGLGSRAAGWVVAAAGAVVACVPLLVVRLVDGDIKGVTLDAGDIVPQSPAVRGAVTLAQA